MARFVLMMLLGILFIGCDSKPVARKPKPSGKRDSQSGIESGTAKPLTAEAGGKPRSAAIPKQLLIKDLLNDKSLNAALQQQLRIRQANGEAKISVADYDKMRLIYDLNFAVEKRAKESWQPVKAGDRSAKVTEIEYPPTPTTSSDLSRIESNFYRLGLEHFRSKWTNVLGGADLKKTLDLFEQILHSTSLLTADDYRQFDLQLTDLTIKNKNLFDDPYFLFAHGVARISAGKPIEAENSFRLATERCADSDYPARFAVRAHARYLNSQNLRLDVKKVSASIFADFFLTNLYWLEHDFRASESELRSALGLLNEFMWLCQESGNREVLAEFTDRVNRMEHLPKWLRLMASGQRHHWEAWRIRGSGWARDVKKENWKKFEEQDKIARKLFREAYELHPEFPESSSFLIAISRAGHDEEDVDYWFDKATSAQSDYMSAYNEMLFSLTPQWGGSVEQMIEFAELHADKEQYETYLPTIMLDCREMGLNRVAGADNRRIFLEAKFARSIIKALDGMMSTGFRYKLNGKRRGPNYLLTIKSIVATEASLYDIARETFEKIGDAPDIAAIKKYGTTSYEMLRGRAYALSSDQAEACQELLDNIKNYSELNTDEKGKVVLKCKEIMDSFGDSPAVDWLNALHDNVEVEYEFESGMRAYLKFDEGFNLWNRGAPSQFEFESRESLLVDNSGSLAPVKITSRLQTNGPRTFRFNIEFLDAESRLAEQVHFTPSAAILNYKGRAFSFGLNRLHKRGRARPKFVFDMAQFSMGFRDTENALYFYDTAIVEGPNEVVVNIAPSYFEAYLNDRFICRSASPNIRGAMRNFEISQPLSRKGRGKVRVSGVSVENWTDPPPIRSRPEELVAYYREQCEAIPDDKWLAFWHAQAVHRAGEFKKAMGLYERAIDIGLAYHEAAFFLGDCKDQLGEHKAAIEFYLDATKPEQEDLCKIFQRTHSDHYTNPCHWAAFRLACLMHISADDSLRKSISEGWFVKASPATRPEWVKAFLEALGAARGGDFNKASSICKSKLLSQSKGAEKEQLERILKSWQQGKQYRDDPAGTPAYLNLDFEIPFFRCFEDDVDPAWKGNY